MYEVDMDLSTITPISKFRTDAPAVLEQLTDTGQPIGLTQHGVVKAVIMSTEAYQEMRNTNAMLKLIALGDNDIRSGNHRPAREALDEMRDMIAKAEAQNG
jgi:prevent-host-death family protein